MAKKLREESSDEQCTEKQSNFLQKKGILDKLHLSSRELTEITIAWFIISVVLFARRIVTLQVSYSDNLLDPKGLYVIFVLLIIPFVVLGCSFILHEMAHKYVAMHFGARAEFQLDVRGLFITVISVMFGIPILAPGAVMWAGELSRYDNIRGRVSAAGPLTNLVIASVSLVILGVTLELNILPELSYAALIAFNLNIFLGLFNLLPFFILDGKKIFDWDFKIWLTIVAFYGVLVLFGIIIGIFQLYGLF